MGRCNLSELLKLENSRERLVFKNLGWMQKAMQEAYESSACRTVIVRSGRAVSKTQEALRQEDEGPE